MRRQIFVALIFAAFIFAAFGFKFRVDPIGQVGIGADRKFMFSDKEAQRSYRVQIFSSQNEPQKSFTLRALTIVKANTRKRFTFAWDEVATTEIESVPGHSVSAKYCSCIVSGVDDNAPNILYDMSHGLTILGAVIEILDDAGTPVFRWSNQSGVYKRGIDATLNDPETKFQNEREQHTRWRRYIKDYHDGYNFWRVDEDASSRKK